MPALQEFQEEGGQHGHRIDALVSGQTVADGGQDEARDLREAVGGDALVGVADGVVAEALQHHVAVGRQVHGIVGARQAGDHVVGGVVEGQLAHHGITRPFMDVLVPAQCAAPGNAAVGGIEQADLRFLVGIDRGYQFGTDLFPGGAAGREIVLDDPLQIALGAQRGIVVASGGGLDACLQLRRRARRDAVDHGVGEAHVGVDPAQDVGVTDLLGEVAQASSHPVAVVAQVVAVLQRDGTSTGLLAGAQQRDEGTVQRLARFAFLHALQVGLQVGEAGVQFAVFQQVVASFGDGEGDDAGDRVGGQLGDGLQACIVGNHLVDGRDPVVFHLAVRIDGFQREIAVLSSQGLQQRVGVGTDVGAGQLPASLALILQALQVDHLVGTVEVAEPQVQDAADDGSGGGCSHDAAPRSRRWNLGQQRVRQRTASSQFNHVKRMRRPIPEPSSRPM